jgi:hypothetical protein
MELFQSNLTRTKENYRESFFINNDFFTFGGENRRKFDEEFFGNEFFQHNRYKLGNLKFSHLQNDNREILGWAEFIRGTGIPINEEKYEIMRRCCIKLLEERGVVVPQSHTVDLKVPKCENFHCTDFFLFFYHKASMGRRL